jgi:thiamine biosynthesis lipoprotein
MITDVATVTFPALGTTTVLLVADRAAARDAQAIVTAEIATVDLACSRFRADSELSRLNSAAGQAVTVSPLLLEALDVALRAAALTNGRVDPTVGGAMRVLGYDRDFARLDTDGPPLQITLAAIPGRFLIAIDRQAHTVRIPAGVEIDLGATAKALCADRAAQAAAKTTGVGVLVSLGGDIAVSGTSPESGWKVRVTDDHAAPVDAPGQTVTITSGGLATSSTSVRRWSRGGRSLHHVLDPATGQPADSVWRTVSVAAQSCVDANTASTAAVILGPAAAPWLTERAMPARLVGVDGTVVHVAGWPPGEESTPAAW